jgi:TolC family type I secretion outer membrane protein
MTGAARLSAAVTLLGALTACTAIPERTVQKAASPAPQEPWTPPEAGRMPAPETAPPPQVPEEYTKPGTTLSLGQLVDVALRNNPVTREAWRNARAAAAEVGSKRSGYFPFVEADGVMERAKTADATGRLTFIQTTYGPSVAASWLLFDFGAREADVQESTRALYSADWAHNAAIQTVVLNVAQEYYRYLNAKAQVVAQQASLEETRRNLAAAEERHRAGVATIADVLQARTQASQVQLALQDAEGQVQIIRGSLATALGVPATVPVDVGELPTDLPLDKLQKNVDELIAKAVTDRPDLAAERFRALAAESHIRAAAVDGMPSLRLDATGARTFFWKNAAPDPFSTTWAGLITLRIPVFRGFQTAYDVQQAREQAEAAKASAERTLDQVILDVWSSYYAVQTAAQRVRTTRDLLASADQSAQVAEGRYRAGVGSILDLLTAQSALAEARSEEAQARSLWFLSVAQLAFSTGVLQPGSPEIRGLPALQVPPSPGTPSGAGNASDAGSSPQPGSTPDGRP